MHVSSVSFHCTARNPSFPQGPAQTSREARRPAGGLNRATRTRGKTANRANSLAGDRRDMADRADTELEGPGQG